MPWKPARADKTEWNEGLAERVGFEPTCRLPDKTLSRRPRYDHFGTSPCQVRVKRTSQYTARLPTAGLIPMRPTGVVIATDISGMAADRPSGNCRRRTTRGFVSGR